MLHMASRTDSTLCSVFSSYYFFMVPEFRLRNWPLFVVFPFLILFVMRWVNEKTLRYVLARGSTPGAIPSDQTPMKDGQKNKLPGRPGCPGRLDVGGQWLRGRCWTSAGVISTIPNDRLEWLSK